MKQESTVKYVLRLALTLLAITAVVACCLAAVNSVTAPRIQAAKEAKAQKAVEAVLPGGGEKITGYADESGIVSKVYASDKGYALEVNPVGFNGPITMMVGVSKDGQVLGISIVTQTETAGLGAVSAAKTTAGENFRGQYAGKSGTLAVTKDGGEIDAITGATITSRAVTAGVNAALACAAGLH